MKRSKTSKAWMREHLNDAYVQQARASGYRARAAYKLLEIDDKDKLLRSGMVVVDLGAGTGYFLPHLSAAVGEEGSVLALDVEDNMLAYMRERVKREHLRNVVVRRVPADGPGLSEASVDRLLIVNTWHHLDHRKLYATKIARALKPGGRLYVVDFDVDSPLGPPVKHRLDPARVVAEVEGGGLEVETVTETLPNQFVVVGRKVGSARRGEER